MARTEGFYLPGSVNAVDGIVANLLVYKSTDLTTVLYTIPFSVVNNRFVIDQSAAQVSAWPDDAQFQIAVGTGAAKRIKNVSIDGVVTFIRGGIASSSNRFVLVSPSVVGTLAVGDTITWNDTGTKSNANDTVKVQLIDSSNNVISQGTSTSAGTYDLTYVPSGAVTLQLLEILRDDNNVALGTGVESLYTGFQGPVSTGDLANVVDLDSMALVSRGNWNTSTWTEAIGITPAFSLGMEELALISVGGQHRIQQRHAKSNIGSTRVISQYDITEAASIRIKQTMMMASNFTFGTTNFGGKFGFGFGGGSLPSGGAIKPDGFTLRPSGNDLPGDNTKGIIDMYSYASGRNNGGNSSFGEIYEMSPVFIVQNGVPFDMEIYAEPNSSFTASDGILQVWINNVLRIDLSDIQWQTEAKANETKPHIDRLIFSEFHGGGTSGWGPANSPTYVDIYNISWEVTPI